MGVREEVNTAIDRYISTHMAEAKSTTTRKADRYARIRPGDYVLDSKGNKFQVREVMLNSTTVKTTDGKSINYASGDWWYTESNAQVNDQTAALDAVKEEDDTKDMQEMQLDLSVSGDGTDPSDLSLSFDDGSTESDVDVSLASPVASPVVDTPVVGPGPGDEGLDTGLDALDADTEEDDMDLELESFLGEGESGTEVGLGTLDKKQEKRDGEGTEDTPTDSNEKKVMSGQGSGDAKQGVTGSPEKVATTPGADGSGQKQILPGKGVREDINRALTFAHDGADTDRLADRLLTGKRK